MSNKGTYPNAPELTSEEVKPTIFGIDEETAKKYTAMLAEVTINPDKPEPEPEPLLSLHDNPILWRGSKHIVCGVSKARKTTYLTLITAILCGKDETAHGFRAHENCKVLFIDTEQARYDSQRILFRVAKLCGVTPTEITKRLTVLSLNKQDPEEIRGIMETAVQTYNPDVLILDNWTDCVTSVNEEAECIPFSRQLRILAESYKLAVYSVVHANESARKDDRPDLRGWAKEESRKGDSTTFLKDMGDYSQVSFRGRHKKPDPFAIGFNADGLPAFVEVTAPEPKNPDRYAKILASIPPTGISYSALCKLIMEKEGKAEPTAKRWVKEMGAILNECNGLYYKRAEAPKNEPEPLPF